MIKPESPFVLIEPIEEEADRDKATSTGILVSREVEDRPDLVVSRGKVLECAYSRPDGTGFAPGSIVYYNYFAGNNIYTLGKDPMGTDDKEYHLVAGHDILATDQ
jgi:co-chaperonin GroES (HSP10)